MLKLLYVKKLVFINVEDVLQTGAERKLVTIDATVIGYMFACCTNDIQHPKLLRL